MSARAAAQLELLGFADLYQYMRGKADWIVRGLRTEPPAPLGERIRAFPYFLNNLAPGLRSAWIAMSHRTTVSRMTRDDVARLAPDAPVARRADGSAAAAVVLNRDGVLLGAIEGPIDDRTTVERRARDAMNPAPQTIRPDMTLALAARLLQDHAYLIVTDAHGRYLGRYHIPSPRPLLCGRGRVAR